MVRRSGVFRRSQRVLVGCSSGAAVVLTAVPGPDIIEPISVWCT